LLCFLESHAGVVSRYQFNGSARQWVSENKKQLNFSEYPGGSSKSLMLSSADSVLSPKLKLPPAGRYMLKLDTWSEKRGRFYIEIRAYDKAGKLLSVPGMYRLIEQLWQAKSPRKRLLPMEIPFDTAPDEAYTQVVIKKWGVEKCWFDNISVETRPEDKLLTADADDSPKNGDFSRDSLMLPGPDGILYPNWTQAGVQEWVTAENKLTVSDFGAIANDDKDDSDALEEAINAAAKAGGGTIQLEPGKYILTRKLLITSDKTIIKGAGRKRTLISFRLPVSQIFVATSTVGAKIIPRIPVQIYFHGANARTVELSIDGKVIEKWSDPKTFKAAISGKGFKSVTIAGRKIIDAVGVGRKQLMVKVSYKGGPDKVRIQPFLLEKSWHYSWDTNALISFDGKRNQDKRARTKLTRELRRGNRDIYLSDTSKFTKGSYILVNAPETERWNKLSLNACTWGNFRLFAARVTDVKRDRIVIKQPSRLTLPLVDNPYVESFSPIRFCGIEDLTVEQCGEIQKDLRIGTIQFRNAADCRARNLTVIKSGFRPVYGRYVRNCQFSNCIFNDAWTQKRSLAYAGFDYAWDSLIEDFETFRMRHAPTLNWTCSGNVIRNSVFHESDAQWHSGWCSDNLFEQCRVESTTHKYNGYGYGFYASPYNDSGHGPGGGPRNVIYNCDSVSLQAAVFMGGGGNNDWMLMYNRFQADSGPGIIQRLGCRNARVEGNVFILKDAKSPMIFYEFLSNTGDVIKNNTVYGGNGKLFQGAGKPREANGNRFLPHTVKTPKTKPPVSSIYKWQLEKYPAKSTE
jgi:hypothetical protein